MKDLASSKIISYLDLHRVTLKLFQKLMDFCEANIPTWEAGSFVVTMRNIRDFIWFLWEAVLKWIHWNGQFGVNASLNALRNGSDQQWPLYTWQILPSGSLLTIIVFLKARQLFNMVLVQLMLGGHVLGLLGHLVQEVASLALRNYQH